MTRTHRRHRTPSAATFQCARCNAENPVVAAVHVMSLRPDVITALALSPEVRDAEGALLVCRACNAHARATVFREQLTRERGALGDIESEISKRAAEHVAVAFDLDGQSDANATLGERLSDNIARHGGSWTFVITFSIFMALWMAANGAFLGREAFDPYPFILLNLVLSCVAAMQAPIILMSQNRSGLRDRAQATQDYRINLKAELEVAALHDKLDLLLHDKWETLSALQEAQMDLLEEVVGRLDDRKK